MRYDKNGLPVNEYYTEELIKPTIDKKKALENQKYYIGASILINVYSSYQYFVLLNFY
jgi:hypothetical protein